MASCRVVYQNVFTHPLPYTVLLLLTLSIQPWVCYLKLIRRENISPSLCIYLSVYLYFSRQASLKPPYLRNSRKHIFLYRQTVNDSLFLSSSLSSPLTFFPLSLPLYLSSSYFLPLSLSSSLSSPPSLSLSLFPSLFSSLSLLSLSLFRWYFHTRYDHQNSSLLWCTKYP